VSTARPPSATRIAIHQHLLAAAALALVLTAGVGGWAATTEFSGAVIAPGQVVVDSNVKKVQHPIGGVVGALNVREGDHVVAGEVLLSFDPTQVRANLLIITKSLDELMARRAREEAERDGADEIAFPPDLLARIDTDPDVAHVVREERKLFDVRRVAREGQRKQLAERIDQARDEIRGYEAQQASKDAQIGWIGKELIGVNSLWQQKLVPYTRITALERDKSRLEGERGQLIASIAQANGKIAETELQILQVDQDMRTETGKDLADIRAKVSELAEKKIAAQDALQRIDVRAPQDGVVQQLSVHIPGEVITPQGEPIMLIVPGKDALTIEARVQPQDIDQLHVGQPAVVRFTAFNPRTTPEVSGEVSRIAADVSEDAKSGARYYTIRIAIAQDEMAHLGAHKLVPGMPAETFIATTPRTVLTYLVRPIHDQAVRAFREN
jgi:HlyD family secretion protein